jgi:hypothetical protein
MSRARLGTRVKALGTGLHISGLVAENSPLILVVPMLFVAGAISSPAAGCALLTHVKTQMPYVLFVGMITTVTYILLSL